MYSRTSKSCGCTGKSNATVAGKTVRRDAFPGTPSAGQRRIADERAAHAHNIRLLTVKDFLRGFHDAYTPHHDDGNIELGMKTAGDVSKVAASFRSIAMALPGFPWVADLLMSFPEGTNEGYGPIFSDSGADRALVC